MQNDVQFLLLLHCEGWSPPCRGGVFLQTHFSVIVLISIENSTKQFQSQPRFSSFTLYLQRKKKTDVHSKNRSGVDVCNDVSPKVCNVMGKQGNICCFSESYGHNQSLKALLKCEEKTLRMEALLLHQLFLLYNCSGETGNINLAVILWKPVNERMNNR